MLQAGISSFIATFGFGIIFNIKGYKLFLAGVGGAIGGMVYTYALSCQMDEVIALFLASVCFSFYSEILARKCKTPVTSFIICALIPLVPGGGMYQIMKLALEKQAVLALQKALDTLTYASSLALGIIVVSTIMQAYYRKRQKHAI